MNIETIKMNSIEARDAFLHYKHDIEKRHKEELDAVQERILEEDRELMEAYRVLARGQRVINFVQQCAELGWKRQGSSDGLPQVAICRASARRCLFTFRHGGDPFFADDDQVRWHGSYYRVAGLKSTVSMPRELWLPQTLRANAGKAFKCKVPTIPLVHRPALKQLPKYHLIFEAEWSLAAPVDPFLCKRIGKNLFAIVAQWDLTPLERALVAGR